jgi:hypothetical protein
MRVLASGCGQGSSAKISLTSMKWAFVLLATLAGCKGGGDTGVRVTLIQSDDAAADARMAQDAADGGGAAFCCSIPRVLTGLEKYDPQYSPYHNVMVNGTQQQQAYAVCDQLSSWPEPMELGPNPTQAQIDLYMAEFMSGPNIAVVMPCLDPTTSPTYGRWQCGGDAGQTAECMNNGWSCGEGSACWFDPGGTSGYGCTGTVTKCTFTQYTPPSG